MGFCLVGEVVLCWFSGLLVLCFFCLFFSLGALLLGLSGGWPSAFWCVFFGCFGVVLLASVRCLWGVFFLVCFLRLSLVVLCFAHSGGGWLGF